MFINVNLKEKRPLYEQICSGVEEQLLLGIIRADEELPSVRSLAVELSINPNTVQKAYALLEQRGFIYSVSGRGSFACDIEKLLPLKREEALKEFDRTAKQALGLGISKNDLKDRLEELQTGHPERL